MHFNLNQLIQFVHASRLGVAAGKHRIWFKNLKRILKKQQINGKIGKQNWATLPTSNGGLGIRRLKDIVLPAFLSSVHGAIDLVSQILHSSDENNICDLSAATETSNVLNSSTPTSPKWLCVAHYSKRAKFYQLDIARFEALQCNESNTSARYLNYWNLYGSEDLGSHLSTTHLFMRCVSKRIGHSWPQLSEKCRNVGSHELNKILSKTLSSIHIPNTLEPPGLCRDDGKR